jgi:hypothetical protein
MKRIMERDAKTKGSLKKFVTNKYFVGIQILLTIFFCYNVSINYQLGCGPKYKNFLFFYEYKSDEYNCSTYIEAFFYTFSKTFGTAISAFMDSLKFTDKILLIFLVPFSVFLYYKKYNLLNIFQNLIRIRN